MAADIQSENCHRLPGSGSDSFTWETPEGSLFLPLVLHCREADRRFLWPRRFDKRVQWWLRGAITSLVADLHSSNVKLTMIRCRSRVLTHSVRASLLLSFSVLSSFGVLSSLLSSVRILSFLLLSVRVLYSLLPGLGSPFSRLASCPFLSSSSSTNRPEVIVAFPAPFAGTLKAPRVCSSPSVIGSGRNFWWFGAMS